MNHKLKLILGLTSIIILTLIQVQTISPVQKSFILMLLSEAKSLDVSRKVDEVWDLPKQITKSDQEALITSFQSRLTWTFWWEPFLLDSEVDLKITAHSKNGDLVPIYFGFNSNKIVMEGFVPCEIPRRVRWVVTEL